MLWVPMKSAPVSPMPVVSSLMTQKVRKTAGTFGPANVREFMRPRPVPPPASNLTAGPAGPSRSQPSPPTARRTHVERSSHGDAGARARPPVVRDGLHPPGRMCPQSGPRVIRDHRARRVGPPARAPGAPPVLRPEPAAAPRRGLRRQGAAPEPGRARRPWPGAAPGRARAGLLGGGGAHLRTAIKPPPRAGRLGRLAGEGHGRPRLPRPPGRRAPVADTDLSLPEGARTGTVRDGLVVDPGAEAPGRPHRDPVRARRPHADRLADAPIAGWGRPPLLRPHLLAPGEGVGVVDGTEVGHHVRARAAADGVGAAVDLEYDLVRPGSPEHAIGSGARSQGLDGEQRIGVAAVRPAAEGVGAVARPEEDVGPPSAPQDLVPPGTQGRRP